MPENNSATIQAPEDKITTPEEAQAQLDAMQNPPEKTEGDRPEWLDEKFSSPEDLAKAYSELQKKMSSGEKPEAEEAPAPDGLSITRQEAAEAAENAGLDFDALAAKYQEKGELEDADYEALEKSGLKRDTVDQYIRGQEAIAEKFESQVYEQFGDKEAYGEMTQWASTNLSETQIDFFNDAIASGDIDKAMFAINGLKAQYESANGSEPSRTVDGKPSQGGPKYANDQEWMADMSKPEYWTDDLFRSKVQEKAQRSFGFS